MHDRPVYSDKRMKSKKDSAGSRKNPARNGQKIRQTRTKNPPDTDKKSTRYGQKIHKTDFSDA